jgi:hypothetical protein
VRLTLLGLCVLLSGAALRPQEIQLGKQLGETQVTHKGHVVLLSDVVDVAAGTPQVVELRFRVEDGFHINSHTPKDELLIPTDLRLEPGGGVKVVDEQYQKGSAFQLGPSGGAGEMLDVYQGEFRVSVRVVAPKGASTLVGELRYQACDNSACFPPRTLPVRAAVRGE